MWSRKFAPNSPMNRRFRGKRTLSPLSSGQQTENRQPKNGNQRRWQWWRSFVLCAWSGSSFCLLFAPSLLNSFLLIIIKAEYLKEAPPPLNKLYVRPQPQQQQSSKTTQKWSQRRHLLFFPVLIFIMLLRSTFLRLQLPLNRLSGIPALKTTKTTVVDYNYTAQHFNLRYHNGLYVMLGQRRGGHIGLINI